MGDERQKQQQPYVLLSAILTALGLFNMLTLHTGPPVYSANPRRLGILFHNIGDQGACNIIIQFQ